jgi:SAM-dependent methyltransferase
MTQNTEFDFDALYRGESPLPPNTHPLAALFGDIVFWDIGGPQPAIVDLEADGGFRGRVLDVGCGLGENALYLAGRGHDVTAVDIAPTAIRRAAARAENLELPVEFLVADATMLDGLAGRTFDTFLDWGLYHGFSPEQRRAYAAALYRVAAPDARVHLVGFSDDLPPELPPPHRCSAQEIRQILHEAGWAVSRFARTTYTANTAYTRDLLRHAVALTDATGGDEFVDSLETDEYGRLLLPAWLITADRIGEPA